MSTLRNWKMLNNLNSKEVEGRNNQGHKSVKQRPGCTEG